MLREWAQKTITGLTKDVTVVLAFEKEQKVGNRSCSVCM